MSTFDEQEQNQAYLVAHRDARVEALSDINQEIADSLTSVQHTLALGLTYAHGIEPGQQPEDSTFFTEAKQISDTVVSGIFGIVMDEVNKESTADQLAKAAGELARQEKADSQGAAMSARFVAELEQGRVDI